MINFPSSPTDGQTYSEGDRSWVYNAALNAWEGVRTLPEHAASHATGGSDPITPASIGAPSGSGTSTGTNTGDQTITLTGDVTGSGTGSFATTITDKAVTLAKLADLGHLKIIGRHGAGAGTPQEVGLDGGLEFNGANIRREALTGDVTASAGSNTTTLATVNANVGSFGSATQVAVVTVNAKGLVTAASATTITPAVGSITGLGTGVATALGIATNGSGGFVTDAGTVTLTNKRIPPRITTITSEATPTVNSDNCDMVTITAQAAAITSMSTNLTGTPNNGEMLLYRIKDNGTARAITWGASFKQFGASLPTTTVLSKTLHALFIWDSVDSKWGCISTAQEF